MTIWLPVLWGATGICLFAGLHFLTVGRAREDASLFTAFGVTCLVVAAYVALSALMQAPATGLRWIVLERLHVAVACAAYPAATWFIGLYSHLRTQRRWVWASVLVFGAFFAINAVRPYGLLLASAQVGRPWLWPWGEAINQVATTPAPTAMAFYASTLVFFGWAFWRCLALARAGEHRRALSLTIYFALQVLAVAYAEYATLHALPGPDWDALPFLIMVVLVGQTLTLELRRNAAALDASVAALNAENARRAAAEARLRSMAYTDATSGLPNRHALGEWLAATLASGRRPHGVLLVVDPRRFAIINHALGHRAGDAMIREIGARLARAAGKTGFAARLDGDEFAAVLVRPLAESPRESWAMDAARQLRDALAAPSRVAGQALCATAHIGLAMFADVDDAEQLLRRAYAALQVAKASARAEPVAFTPAMQADSERRLRLEAELRPAMALGHLQLVYQPQVDRTGALVGAEALLRWQHPEYGAIPPLEFVTLAEHGGQMPELGAFVLREACHTLATLHAPEHFRLSINISPRQLFLSDFVGGVQAAISGAGVDPHRITLEITETAFIDDVQDAAAKLAALSALGIRVSIDDFGTGYASIASLKAFPVHELKIDQSFIHGMSTQQPDRFVAAMVALGRALDIDVVAEGVEREDQHASLMQLGCTAFQGFLVGRPIAADALRQRFREAARSAQPTVPTLP